jgi:hypothetical protein
MGGGTLVDFSLLKSTKTYYDDSFVMVRALASTRNENFCSVERTHARLLVCPSPQQTHTSSHNGAKKKHLEIVGYFGRSLATIYLYLVKFQKGSRFLPKLGRVG